MRDLLIRFYLWLSQPEEYEHFYDDPGFKILAGLIVVLFIVVAQAAVRGALK